MWKGPEALALRATAGLVLLRQMTAVPATLAPGRILHCTAGHCHCHWWLHWKR